MKNFRGFLITIVSLLSMNLTVCAEENVVGNISSRSGLICDIEAARQWCDSHPLRPEEGIWIYPEDNVTLLVRRLPASGNNVIAESEITVIGSPDCRLKPGELIGTLSAEAQSKTFEIKMFSRKKNNVFAGLKKGIARLTDDGNGMTFSFPKLKFRFRLNSIIPNFWKNVSVSYQSPFEKLNRGMVKVYPSYDGNGSDIRTPIYL